MYTFFIVSPPLENIENGFFKSILQNIWIYTFMTELNLNPGPSLDWNESELGLTSNFSSEV